MRKVIFDTDVCSDDAAALLLALKEEDVEVLAVTTVTGGVLLKQATLNALQTCEIAGSDVPVYVGAAKPLFKDPFVTTSAHGADGMGACGLIHPTTKPVEGVHASDAILDLVRKYPGQIDMLAVAPLTNLGLAILKDRDTMQQLKSITIMGTGGFGPGNVNAVAEANVFSDAESYDLVLGLDVPTTILGFDLCIGDSAFSAEEMQMMETSGKAAAEYVAKASGKLLQYNMNVKNNPFVDVCDAVAVGCYLWPEIVKKSVPCNARVAKEGDFYGQVIFWTEEHKRVMESHGLPFDFTKNQCTVVAEIDTDLFKEKFKASLLA